MVKSFILTLIIRLFTKKEDLPLCLKMSTKEYTKLVEGRIQAVKDRLKEEGLL